MHDLTLEQLPRFLQIAKEKIDDLETEVERLEDKVDDLESEIEESKDSLPEGWESEMEQIIARLEYLESSIGVTFHTNDRHKPTLREKKFRVEESLSYYNKKY